MTRRPFPLPHLLLAALLLAATGCTQGHESMTTDARSFDNPAQAQFVAAVRDGNAALARELLASGANANAATEEGTPALNWLIRQGDRDAVRLLLELGADPTRGDAKGRTALHEAALSKDANWIDLLLERGVPVDVPNTRNGQTALFDALRAREADNIDRLLAAGAKVDVRDRTGTTPLHQAALVNDIPSVKRFMEAGADPHATDDTGATFASYLYDGDPSVLAAPVRRDYQWIRERLGGATTH
ncbi:ankyrin repeat domain-containing protein [Luteimonas sp. XNQY3]|nr:ankyrin repeat domain-containing protein [Luteimonas sp. XNQY3]MCD9004897.1 ankyrin repeat domain-containing protein [Luteimonas sp. XNQY3]